MNNELIKIECKNFIQDLINKMFTNNFNTENINIVFDKDIYIGYILKKSDYNIFFNSDNSFIYKDNYPFYFPLVDFQNGNIACLRDFGLPIILEKNKIDRKKFFSNIVHQISYFSDLYYESLNSHTDFFDDNFYFFQKSENLNTHFNLFFNNQHKNFNLKNTILKDLSSKYLIRNVSESIDLMLLLKDKEIPEEIKELLNKRCYLNNYTI